MQYPLKMEVGMAGNLQTNHRDESKSSSVEGERTRRALRASLGELADISVALAVVCQVCIMKEYGVGGSWTQFAPLLHPP